MEENVPDWLDEEFLKTAIINSNANTREIEIQDYKVEPAVKEGDNYCSTMYRVRINYREKESRSTASISLIIKAPVAEDGIFKDVVDEGNLTNNEYVFYKQVLPKLEEILHLDFIPKSYACTVENVLVMEDLKQEDYVMCDRHAQLDYDHCESFIKTLAKFHAATVALHERNPEVIEKNGNESMFTKNIVTSDRYSVENEVKITTFAKAVEKLDEMKTLAKVIQENHKELGSIVVDIFNKNDSAGLKVLNHGDCWVNNILYNHDQSNKVVGCKLVDYQLRRYASPATDLVYFLISSPQAEVRENDTEELLQVYLEILNRTLSELECQARLSAQQHKEDMTRLTPFAMFIATVFLPAMMSEPVNNSLVDSNAPYLHWFTGNAFNKILPHVCKQLLLFGVLEYFDTSL